MKFSITYQILILIILSVLHTPVYAEMLETKFAYIGSDKDSSYQGAQQGLIEANLQGQFLQHSYTIDIIAPDKAPDTDYTGYIAVINGADASTFIKLTDLLPDTPVFNVTLAEDSLRLDCKPNALHIYPSNQMKHDAVAQWHKKNPDDEVIAQTWHPDFVKFAARDLNKRYSKTHSEPMDDAAWAGWAAVKMSSEAIVRENFTKPGLLLNYLKNDLQFDGQMGVEMNFRSNGQLRQPMLIIKDKKIIGEAPVRGVSDDLDSLGNAECAK